MSERVRARRPLILLSVIGLVLVASPRAALAAPAPAATPVVAGSTGVFAIDDDLHTVVFIPDTGGRPRPVTPGLTNPTQIAASRAGSVFVVDGTRLLKVNPRGGVTTLRTGMAPRAQLAVDDNNWLFVLDGTTIAKYSPRDGSAPVVVGTVSAGDVGYLTVDGAGNASVTAPNPADYLQTLITTYPVRGGKPVVRKLVDSTDETQDFFEYPSAVVEARNGTIYVETGESGGSGATNLDRVPPGPAGTAKAYSAAPSYSEYVFDVDSLGSFYLLQNRKWCTNPGRFEENCVDDYGVDVVQRYDSSGAGRADIPVSGVDLPVGGISVAASGAIYAAVLVSSSAGLQNNTAVPRMLRIDPAGGPAVVLAQGHFAQPVADDFLWYAA